MSGSTLPWIDILPTNDVDPAMLLRASQRSQAKLEALRRWWERSAPPTFLAAMLDPNRLYWLRLEAWDSDRLEGRLWLTRGRAERSRNERICLRVAEVVDWLVERSPGVFEGGFLLREMHALRQTRRKGLRLAT